MVVLELTESSPDYTSAFIGVVGVISGGLIAWVAGAIGSAIQARREHQRWIRQEQYSLMREVLRITDAFGLAPGAKKHALAVQLGELASTIPLLFPMQVSIAFADLVRAMLAGARTGPANPEGMTPDRAVARLLGLFRAELAVAADHTERQSRRVERRRSKRQFHEFAQSRGDARTER